MGRKTFKSKLKTNYSQYSTIPNSDLVELRVLLFFLVNLDLCQFTTFSQHLWSAIELVLLLLNLLYKVNNKNAMRSELHCMHRTTIQVLRY